MDLSPLEDATRILFSVPLRPLQGDRFQPTGFPSLGAATYQTEAGQKLLVESAQSMANRLEATCWDDAARRPVTELEGISHVEVRQGDAFLTDTMLEAHRLNSPYVLEAKPKSGEKSFLELLKADLGGLERGPVDRSALARSVLRFDAGSLIHGLFLAKDSLAGGRLRIPRAMSAFIEAEDVRIAASGGVKNDHVAPSGDTSKGYGNVPFSRDEFTAGTITCHASIDLSQIRGYGLDESATRMLTLLSLYKLRKLMDGDLRLRTACDLEPLDREKILAKRPDGFELPELEALRTALADAVKACAAQMRQEVVTRDK